MSEVTTRSQGECRQEGLVLFVSSGGTQGLRGENTEAFEEQLLSDQSRSCFADLLSLKAVHFVGDQHTLCIFYLPANRLILRHQPLL